MEGVSEDVVIVGGGIAGLATAVALKRVGIGALVLERSEELRACGAALTLAGNAWHALDALGVSHKLISKYSPLKMGHVTDIDRGTTQEINLTMATGTLKEGPRAVHRKVLLNALADELEADRIRFSSKLISIETQSHQGLSIAVLHLEDGTIIKAKVVIGCDGIHSIVARWLGLAEPVNSGRAAIRGLAVFPEEHAIDHEFRQFVGECKRGGYIPLSDQDLYCFLVYKSPPNEESTLHDPQLIQRQVIENHANDFPQTYHDIFMHCDLSTLSWAPLLYRRPRDVMFGKLSKGVVTVAGDAMHPMTPDLGQGGCVALEDAVILGRHIGKAYIRSGRRVVPGEMERAVGNYVKERRRRVAWVVTASLLSGWSQHGGSGWCKLFREVVFYKFVFPRIVAVADFDCGKLVEGSYVRDGELEDLKNVG